MPRWKLREELASQSSQCEHSVILTNSKSAQLASSQKDILYLADPGHSSGWQANTLSFSRWCKTGKCWWGIAGYRKLRRQTWQLSNQVWYSARSYTGLATMTLLDSHVYRSEDWLVVGSLEQRWLRCGEFWNKVNIPSCLLKEVKSAKASGHPWYWPDSLGPSLPKPIWALNADERYS